MKSSLNKKEYDLIINCDANNFLAKKHFTKKKLVKIIIILLIPLF